MIKKGVTVHRGFRIIFSCLVFPCLAFCSFNGLFAMDETEPPAILLQRKKSSSIEKICNAIVEGNSRKVAYLLKKNNSHDMVDITVVILEVLKNIPIEEVRYKWFKALKTLFDYFSYDETLLELINYSLEKKTQHYSDEEKQFLKEMSNHFYFARTRLEEKSHKKRIKEVFCAISAGKTNELDGIVGEATPFENDQITDKDAQKIILWNAEWIPHSKEKIEKWCNAITYMLEKFRINKKTKLKLEKKITEHVERDKIIQMLGGHFIRLHIKKIPDDENRVDSWCKKMHLILKNYQIRDYALELLEGEIKHHKHRYRIMEVLGHFFHAYHEK